MSATLSTPKTTSGGEIIRELVNASDGQGLHFDGAAGNIDIASPPDLGTKFSMEFIVQADEWDDTVQRWLVDFNTSGRFVFGGGSTKDELSVFSVGSWFSFGVKVLDDLKVHHLVVTIDGTAAILYDNGNQVGTATILSPNIDLCTDAAIGAQAASPNYFFNGTIYRARLWNKSLSQAEVTASYENATVPFADQYGSQTIVIPGDFTGNLDGWDTFSDWNSQTNPSNNMVLAASAATQVCRNSVNLTAGKKYRCTYTASAVTGAPSFDQYNGDGTYTAHGTIESGTKTFEFDWPIGLTYNFFYIRANSSTAAVTLDDISVVEIGCVADYDLAFANPTQSLMVPDRAGAADGTSSATGVVQVTPIVQVNATAARIGTSQLSPSDGQLVVDSVDVRNGNVRIISGNAVQLLNTANDTNVEVKNSGGTGVAEMGLLVAGSQKLAISSAGNSTFSGDVKITKSNPALGLYSTASSPQVNFGNAAGTNHWSIYETVPADGTQGSLNFYDSVSTAARLTIDSAGLVTASNGIASNTTQAMPGNSNNDTGVVLASTGRCHFSSDVDHTMNRTAAGTLIEFRTAGATAVGSIGVAASSTSFNTSSDYRLKENVTALTGALDRLDSIPVYNFNFKTDPTKTVDGFLAHEVAEFVPEAITGTKDEMQTVVTTEAVAAVEAVAATYYEEGDELPDGVAIGDEKTPAVEAVEAVAEVTEEQPKYQGIDQSKLVPLMLAAIKELKAKVTALENA